MTHQVENPVSDLSGDVELEAVILGCALVNNAALLTLRRWFPNERDFIGHLHRRAYTAMLALASRGEPADLVTLTGELRRAGDLNHQETVSLAALLRDGFKTENVGHYCAELAERVRRRRLVGAAESLVRIASNGATPEEVDAHLSDLQVISRRRGQPLPADNLSDVLLRPAPATPWAIDGLLAEGDIAILSGPGGIGKSWLTLHLVLILAAGLKLFDRFAVTRPYTVVFVDLESRPWEVDQRLHRLVLGYPGELGDIGKRVKVVRRRIRLDVEADLSALLSSIETWGADFVFIDSFRRAFAGDETRAEEVSGLFVHALDRIRTETGAGSLLVDHTRKKSGDPMLDDPGEALRGSADKRNMVDCHLGLEQRQERLALLPSKTRHSRLPGGLLLEMAGLEEDADVLGPVTITCAGSLELASDAVQDAVLALLRDAGEAGLLRGDLIGRCGYSKRSVADGLAALKGRSRVRSAKDGRQARYWSIG